MRKHVLGLVAFIIATTVSVGLVALRERLGSESQLALDPTATTSAALLSPPSLVARRSSRDTATTRPTVTFDGQLIAFDPNGYGPCGYIAFYQRARYHIIRVLDGEYEASEIVVDHLACERDVFEGLGAGDYMRVTVELRLDHSSEGSARSGENALTPSIVFVATDAPTKLGRDAFVAPPN